MYWIFLTPKPLTPVEPFLREQIDPFFQLIIMSIPPFAHTLENQLIMVPLLTKHTVQGKVRVQWILACLVTGGFAIRKFKILLEKEKELVDGHRKNL
jgi:hypothetical protein